MKKQISLILLTFIFFGCIHVPALSQVTQQQVDKDWSGTATGTDTYSVTISKITSTVPYNFQTIYVQFTNANTTAATLKVYGSGSIAYSAIGITLNGSNLVGGEIVANIPYTLKYNSNTTKWVLDNFQAGSGSGSAWKTNGNTVANGNVFGSTNNRSVDVVTNNTLAAIIDSNQRVCIGTSFPIQQFEVRKSQNDTTMSKVINTSTGINAFAGIGLESDAGKFFLSRSGSGYAVPNTLFFQDANAFRFVANGNIGYTQNSSGNIGMLTASPNTNFTVGGNADITGTLGIGTGTTSVTSRVQILGTGTSSGSSGFGYYNNSNLPVLYGRDDQRVGIGTASPSSGLHVRNSSLAESRIISECTGNTVSARISAISDVDQTQMIQYGSAVSFDSDHPYTNANVSLFWGGGGGGTWLGNENSAGIYLFTGSGASSSAKVFVNPSGLVVIGNTTVTPSSKLQIVNTNTAIPVFQSAGTASITTTVDGRLYGSALHNNSGSVTGTTNQYIASGTYTPTITDSANTSARTAYQCNWIRVGNEVTVSGVADVDPTTTLTITIIKMTLPIVSDFSGTFNCRGTTNSEAIAGQSGAVLCTTSYTSDFALLKWNTTDVTNQPMSFTYTYLIQ